MRPKAIMIEQGKAAEIPRISGVRLIGYKYFGIYDDQSPSRFTIEEQNLSITITKDCKTKYKVVGVQHDEFYQNLFMFTVISISRFKIKCKKQFCINDRDFFQIFSIKSPNQPYFRSLLVIGGKYVMSSIPLGIIWMRKILELKGLFTVKYKMDSNNYNIKPFQTKTMIIRETVRFIGDLSFYNNENITLIALPPSVEIIGYLAFNNCKNLRKVTIKGNSKLRKIGINAFGNTAISSFNIPASIEEIGCEAFRDCKKLKTFTFHPNSKLKKISPLIIYDSIVESIEIPSSVEEIGKESFRGARTITSVTFSLDSRLKKIGHSAFNGINIKSIEIPASVEVIDDYAFANCQDLIVVTFAKESKLKIIGDSAFSFTSIISIRIPASVEKIGELAFGFCKKLHGIIHEEESKHKRVSSYAFYSTPIYEDSSCECY